VAEPVLEKDTPAASMHELLGDIRTEHDALAQATMMLRSAFNERRVAREHNP
jgi:hypothetical protein